MCTAQRTEQEVPLQSIQSLQKIKTIHREATMRKQELTPYTKEMGHKLRLISKGGGGLMAYSPRKILKQL